MKIRILFRQIQEVPVKNRELQKELEHRSDLAALRLRPTKAVQKVSLELHGGQVLALIGENGSGNHQRSVCCGKYFSGKRGTICDGI